MKPEIDELDYILSNLGPGPVIYDCTSGWPLLGVVRTKQKGNDTSCMYARAAMTFCLFVRCGGACDSALASACTQEPLPNDPYAKRRYFAVPKFVATTSLCGCVTPAISGSI